MVCLHGWPGKKTHSGCLAALQELQTCTTAVQLLLNSAIPVSCSHQCSVCFSHYPIFDHPCPTIHPLTHPPPAGSLPPTQAIDLVKSGKAVLVDIRLADDFAKEHAAGAVNVPLFRITAGDSGWDKAKRFIMASLVMKATGGGLSRPHKCRRYGREGTSPVCGGWGGRGWYGRAAG